MKAARLELTRPEVDPDAVINKQINKLQNELDVGKRSSSFSNDEYFAYRVAISGLRQGQKIIAAEDPVDGSAAFALLKAEFDRRTKLLKKHAEEASRKLSNMFKFCEDVFEEGQEMVILVTELTISHYGARFISRYGCKEYFAHNKELLFYERQKEIIAEMEKLDL